MEGDTREKASQREVEFEIKGEKERKRERGRGRAGCESAVTTEGRGSAKFKHKNGRTILTRRGRQTYLHKRHWRTSGR